MNKLSGFLALTLAFAAGGARAFVYETVSEFQAEGDFDGNGTIDLSDFGALKANFGFSRPAAAVPEPSTWALGLVGGFLGLLARSRAKAAREP